MTQVLVVDDSQFVRTALAAALGDRGYDVHTASDGEAAVEATVEREPDVVTMDVRMPGTDGIEAVRRIMARRPTPIVMLSAHTREGADATLDALSLGAMDVVPKPGGEATSGIDDLADELAETVEAVRDADVASVTWERAAAAARTAASAERAVQAASAAVRGVSPPDASTGGAPAVDGTSAVADASAVDGTRAVDDAAAVADALAVDGTRAVDDAAAVDDSSAVDGTSPADPARASSTDLWSGATGAPSADPFSRRNDPGSRSDVSVPASLESSPTVVVGASTGGPRILERVLAELPLELDARVLVVQHMPASFTDRLARRLDGVSSYDVREAADGSRVTDGEALVARGDYHAVVTYAGEEHLRVRLDESEPVHGVRPAIDVTMQSAASTVDGPLVGVALSGMGRDAADGISAIAAAGGATIALDRESAPVAGIPEHAVGTGDVDRVLPTPDLAEGIVDAAVAVDRDADVAASARTEDAVDDDLWGGQRW